jgi:geranylgeranyl pyrophosphate synthase
MFSDLFQKVIDRKIRYEKQLAESGRYMSLECGKRIRSILFYMFAPHDPTDMQHETISIVEMIHNASVIHDDVIDQNNIRRGGNSCRKVLDNKMSILMGDKVVIESIKRFIVLHNNDIFIQRYFLRECQSTVHGALLEQNLNKKNGPTRVEEYFRMASLKTGSLFKLSCLLGAYMSRVDHIRPATFGLCFGILFQIQNDLNSYVFDYFYESEDYVQKNISFPIIILVNYFAYDITTFKNRITQQHYEAIKRTIETEQFRIVIQNILQKYLSIVYSVLNQFQLL